MPDHGRQSPARLLAPIALALFALALAVVIVTSNASDDGGGSGRDAAGGRTSVRKPTTQREGRRGRATYTVKIGDTLGAIAEQTGVSVERLQELNPELDPQAMVSGQKIKLRE